MWPEHSCLQPRLQTAILLSKILFLSIRNFANRWFGRHGWDIFMNQLAVISGDRCKPQIVDWLLLLH
jgi:hypothetical protein